MIKEKIKKFTHNGVSFELKMIFHHIGKIELVVDKKHIDDSKINQINGLISKDKSISLFCNQNNYANKLSILKSIIKGRSTNDYKDSSDSDSLDQSGNTGSGRKRSFRANQED